ncbi:MAG: 2-C-methyl-D-erythritol 4-phosphate cytidylyltransferase [Eubacterium sp.]|nr:2-C-methyl-D-erythritol 4-phosphate cytidylyltransferase [Eubacterium sp.]
MKEKTAAIIVAAGRGSRMGTKIQKQYLKLLGKPILAYTLEAFEKSETDEIILVVGEGEEDYVTREIIRPYGISRVTRVVAGGKERYESVWNGLQAVKEGIFPEEKNECFVLIHDGARAFITPEQINFCIGQVREHRACVMGMPVKDTIKVVDSQEYTVSTPDRSTLWQMQTPQCFELTEISSAYRKMFQSGAEKVTDDAMVMESFGERPVKMIRGSYDNIKVTTPEDLILGEAILKEKINIQN